MIYGRAKNVSYEVLQVQSFVKPLVLHDELVEALGRLRTCREIMGVNLLQNSDQYIITKIQ